MIKNTQPGRNSFLILTGLLSALLLIVISLAGCAGSENKQTPSGGESGQEFSRPQNLPVADESQLRQPPRIITDLSPLNPQPESDALVPGLSVVYFYSYFARHLNPLTKYKVSNKKGRPGQPIPFLNHQFGKSEVFHSGTNRGVAMRMHGLMRFVESGAYTFIALSNDGLRVYISGQMIIDDPTQHSDRYAIRAVARITDPGWYPVKVEYFQRKGTAAIGLFWRRPGAGSFEPVPAEAYAHIPGSVR